MSTKRWIAWPNSPRTYSPRDEGEAAEKDDVVVIDFVGSVDGVRFAGGKGEDFNLTLGSGQFIPGFEDQLIGAKAGESRDVKVTFPAEYHAAETGRQRRGLRRHGEGSEEPEADRDRRRAGQEAGPGRSRHPARTACASR